MALSVEAASALRAVKHPFTCAAYAMRAGRVTVKNTWLPFATLGLLLSLLITLGVAWVDVQMQPIVSRVISTRLMEFPGTAATHRTLVMGIESPYVTNCTRISADVIWLERAGNLPISVPVTAIINGGPLGSIGHAGDVNRFEVWGALPVGLPAGRYHVAHRSWYDCEAGPFSWKRTFVLNDGDITLTERGY